MSKELPSQHIWYLGQPTIGYCRECDRWAVFNHGLKCPVNEAHKITKFVWDHESPAPEGD